MMTSVILVTCKLLVHNSSQIKPFLQAGCPSSHQIKSIQALKATPTTAIVCVVL